MLSTITSALILFCIIAVLLYLLYRRAQKDTPQLPAQGASKPPVNTPTVSSYSTITSRLCLVALFLTFAGFGIASLVAPNPDAKVLDAYRDGGRSVASQIVVVDADKAVGHPSESTSLKISRVIQHVIMGDALTVAPGQTRIQIDGERTNSGQEPACFETEIGLFQDSDETEIRKNIQVRDLLTTEVLPYAQVAPGWTYVSQLVRGARRAAIPSANDLVGILKICLGARSFAQGHFSVLVAYSKVAPKTVRPIRIVYVDPRDFANQMTVDYVTVTIEDKYPLGAWWTVCLPEGCVNRSTSDLSLKLSSDRRIMTLEMRGGLEWPGVMVYYESLPEDSVGVDSVMSKLDR